MQYINWLQAQAAFFGISNVYLQSLFVFIFFVVIAFIVRFLFTSILTKLVSKTSTEIDDKIISTTENPILITVLLIGLYFAGLLLKLDKYDIFTNIFYTLLSFLIFWIFFKVILITIRGLKDTLADSHIKVFESKIFPFFERSLKIALAITYLFIIFYVWEIDITPLLASAGIFGLAIAFAAKDTIANVFGGVSIFLDKSYLLGDFIIVDNKDRGEVVDIGLRSTKLRTRDDELISIPNSIMANSKVINESGIEPKLRVRVDIDVSYNSDLDHVEKVLMDIAEKAEYVEKNPKPRVRFREFTEFSIKAQLLFWVKRPVFKGRYKSFIIKDIHKRFNKEKISFPYPAQEIFLRK